MRRLSGGSTWCRTLVAGLLSLGMCSCATAAGQVAVPVLVRAGPTCPVVTDPPDPECDDRPVAGAELVVLGGAGRAVARARTDADGRATLSLRPGTYTLRARPVSGLLGTPADQPLVVSERPAELVVVYDTGIR